MSANTKRAMPIAELQIPVGNANCYSPGFRNLIENYLIRLRNHPSTTLTPVDTLIENKYIGDFYQLLVYLRVNQDLFWVTLRLNDLHSPTDYAGDLNFVLVPSDHVVKGLLAKYLNSSGIN